MTDTADIVVSANGQSKKLQLSMAVVAPPGGGVLPLHGDADVYKMRRLRWLDSSTCSTTEAIACDHSNRLLLAAALGVDEEVTKPFTNLTATAAGGVITIGV